MLYPFSTRQQIPFFPSPSPHFRLYGIDIEIQNGIIGAGWESWELYKYAFCGGG